VNYPTQGYPPAPPSYPAQPQQAYPPAPQPSYPPQPQGYPAPQQGYGPPQGYPAPQGYPQQNFGQPQGYPQPSEPAPQGDLDAYLNQPAMSGNSLSKFVNGQVGQSLTFRVARTITKADIRPDTDSNNNVLKWRDGNYRWVMVVPCDVPQGPVFPDGRGGSRARPGTS
jgi:hypothetical protein